MIYNNELENKKFLEEYSQFCDDSILLKTITDKSFSGAILPSDEDYYLVASSLKEWNLLSSLVKSFLGVSFSDFVGVEQPLTQKDKIESYLLKKSFSFLSKVTMEDNNKRGVDAFIMLYQTYKKSPQEKSTLPLHITHILGAFKEALRYQDINSAKKIITQLKEESRIDALNLKFMEIELYHTLKDWESIVHNKEITALINGRKPLRVRLHIIEAFFYTYLYQDFSVSIYNKKLKPVILTLMFDAPSNISESIKTIYFLAYHQKDIEYRHIEKIIDFLDTNSYLSLDQKKEIRERIDDKKLPTTTLDNNLVARASIIYANNSDTLESIEQAKESLENIKKREQLQSKSIHQEILKQDKMPQNWLEWIEALSDNSFREAISIAEHGLEEWNIDKHIGDPMDVEELSVAIASIEEEIAQNRFISALPLLLESFERGFNYPNPLYQSIYIAILEFIVIFEVHDQKTLIASQGIIENLFLIAPNEEGYKNILELSENIIEKIEGKNLVDWLLDYAELLISYNSPHHQSRDNLLEKTLQQVYKHKEWLKSYQIDLLLKLATVIGIEDLFISSQEQKSGEVIDEWEKYKNKTIGIYTLSENAGKEAKKRLEEYIGNIKVVLNHDKASTTALKNIAHTSDYFVLVTQSAKHAASGAIQKILRQRDIDPLFPIGKGSSSIIASLL